jgi:outer membrane protein TolC
MQVNQNIFLKICLFLLMVLTTQEVLRGQAIDLEAYQTLISNQNIQLKQSLNEIRLAEKDTRLSKGALLPSVNGSFSYQRDFTKNFLFLNDTGGAFPSKFQTNFNNNFAGDIIASQNIYSPAQLAAYKLTKMAEETTRLSHVDMAQVLKTQAAQLFWQAIYTRESLKVLEENQDLAKAQWEQMKTLFEEGYASQLQVYQTASFYQRSIPQIKSARNTYQVLLNEMKGLANLTPNDSLILKGEIMLSDEAINAMILEDKVLANNPSIKLLQQQLLMAEQQIAISKAMRYPVVQANLGYNFNAQDNAFSFKNNNSLLYGQIAVQIPIYSGGTKKTQIEKDIINRENARLAIQQKKMELQKDLKNATLDFEVALQKILEEKEAIALGVKELAIAVEGSKEGTVTPLELKETRLGLTQSKLNLLNGYLDLHIAQLKTKRIIGNY